MKPGPFDNRPYDAAAWGADLIGFAPPFVAWEVARPDPHPSFWIVTDNTGTILTAGDTAEGFATAGLARSIASHFEALRTDAIEAERMREIEASDGFRYLSALMWKPAGRHRSPRTLGYLRAMEGR